MYITIIILYMIYCHYICHTLCGCIFVCPLFVMMSLSWMLVWTQTCAVFFFPTDVSSSPPGPYQQDAYVIRAEEKLKHPPFLPPHLLQVLLNKDTGVSVSSDHSTHLTGGKNKRITNQLLVSPPVRPDAASRAQPRDAQPPVRPVHQGDGTAHGTCMLLFWHDELPVLMEAQMFILQDEWCLNQTLNSVVVLIIMHISFLLLGEYFFS